MHDAKKAVFSTDISKAYPEEAKVDKWVRSYTLNRGKKFTINDNYQLEKITGETSLNFVTNCNVSEAGPGVLKLEGDGFSLQIKYNSGNLTPKIEVIKIADRGLKRYWNTITRIVLQVNNPKTSGKNEIVISKI